MAITGIDTIEGKQIIAAGAVSARSAEMAYNDENGNPITGYLSSVPVGTMNESAFGYNGSNIITGYNGSAFPQGGGGAGVSGTNVVFVPDYEGAEYGEYWSASISGDIKVATGNYDMDGALLDEREVYSLSSIGNSLDSKLDKSSINDSNTLINYEGHPEVFEKAYRATGFTNGSAEDVSLDSNGLYVVFDSDEIEPESHLYSAIVTIETTTTGDVPEDWNLISYENNSAILTRTFPIDKIRESVSLDKWDGWNITNCDASATVYSALEIAPLAFKDEIPQGATEAIETVTANSADWNGTTDTVSSNSGAWGGSALPISAGPGVKISLVDNTLVFSNDETVLFETTSPSGVSAVTCSETIKNFERIAILPSRFATTLGGGTGPYQYYETKWLTTGTDTVNSIEPMIFEYLFWKISKYSANNDYTQLVWNGGFEVQQDTHTYRDMSTCNVGIKKIIGINRIAGGN